MRAQHWPRRAAVITYTLCRHHEGVYYLYACPCCYLADMRRVEIRTRHPEPVDLRGLAYLRRTSIAVEP